MKNWQEKIDAASNGGEYVQIQDEISAAKASGEITPKDAARAHAAVRKALWAWEDDLKAAAMSAARARRASKVGRNAAHDASLQARYDAGDERALGCGPETA